MDVVARQRARAKTMTDRQRILNSQISVLHSSDSPPREGWGGKDAGV